MFATLATGIFRNSPWHLGQGNLLTIHFIETYYGSHQSQRTGLDLTLGPKVMTATHCDPSYVYMYNVDATIS